MFYKEYINYDIKCHILWYRYKNFFQSLWDLLLFPIKDRDLIAYMMPHAIIILITSIIFFGVWLMFNLPIGFNTVNFF